MAEKSSDLASRDQQRGQQPQQRLASREGARRGSPFGLLERFADEIDSVFDEFGMGRSWLVPTSRGRQGLRTWDVSSEAMWAPQVEVSQEGHELVVRADLPGMKRTDIDVEVGDNDITISGERKQEQRVERGGVLTTERIYGNFYRVVPLPDGAMADEAKATFRDGVLEIRLPAPPEQVRRGRRLEIQEGS